MMARNRNLIRGRYFQIRKVRDGAGKVVVKDKKDGRVGHFLRNNICIVGKGVDKGQVNGKGGPFSFDTVDENVATQSFHQFPRNGQSESRASVHVIFFVARL